MEYDNDTAAPLSGRLPISTEFWGLFFADQSIRLRFCGGRNP